MSKTLLFPALLFVRIQPSQKSVNRFFRCGIEFGKAWQEVRELDVATAKRLEEEQMLEVSETRPADFDDEAQAGDSAAALSTASSGDSGTPANAPVVHEKPADPAVVLSAVLAAVAQLDKNDPTLFTASNKPKTEAIAAILGWPVTAAERDAALVTEGA